MSHKTLHRTKKKPTIIDVLVIVLLLGLLLAVAVPKYLNIPKPYNQTRSSCIANLKVLDSAKEQWAMDNKKAPGAVVRFKDLVGLDLYIKSEPVCPKGGYYVVGSIGTNPTCSIEGHAIP